MIEPLYHMARVEVVGLILAVTGILMWLVGMILVIKFGGTGKIV